MEIKRLKVSPMGNNCYFVISDRNNAAIVDPGGDLPEIMKTIKENRLKVLYVLLTHGHFDHVGYTADIVEKTGARVACHILDKDLAENSGDGFGLVSSHVKPVKIDDVLEDGDEIAFDDVVIKTMHLPGHSPGSCVYLVGQYMLSGDVLFKGFVGRCDFTGGSVPDMKKSITKLNAIKEDYEVLPGHDDTSTLSHEQKNNPYLLSLDYDIYD